MSQEQGQIHDEEGAARLLFALIDGLPVTEQTDAAGGILRAIEEARAAQSPQPLRSYLVSLERAAEVHKNPVFHKRIQEADGQIAEGVGVDHVDSRTFLNELVALRG